MISMPSDPNAGPSQGGRPRVHGWLLACSLLWLALVAGVAAPAASPAPTNALVLGMSTVLTGPAANLGTSMRDGVLAALAEANRQGGIAGRPLHLVALDDGYEPTRTAPNMRALLEQHQVLTVIGNVGTPTAVAAIPIANEGRLPFFGAFTGAGVLRRSPPDRYVINFRASYAEETAEMVNALVQVARLRPEEIAFFTQRDAYGDSGFGGGLAALQRHGLTNGHGVPHVRYERNTVAVEKALAELLLLDPLPRAVIMVGAYAPCAAFIRLAREHQFTPLFLNVSFVGAASLADALGAQGDGVIVTQVVPHFEAELPLTREFRLAMKQAALEDQVSFGSLEGYIAARILLRALARVPGMPTRETIVEALEGLGQFDLGLGVPLELSPSQHQACHKVWPTVLNQGRYRSLNWEDLVATPRAP